MQKSRVFVMQFGIM